MSNFNLFDYKTTDSKNYTHQSLNGGKFNISMDKIVAGDKFPQALIDFERKMAL